MHCVRGRFRAQKRLKRVALVSVGAQLRKLYSMPMGRRLIGWAMRFSSPYSAGIGARVLELAPGHARFAMPDKRSNRNHLQCIHACALATLTETTVGASVLFSLPDGMRGIATGLAMQYHAKARGPVTAECRWAVPVSGATIEQDIAVELRDAAAKPVATGTVRFRFSPGKAP